MPPLTLYNTLTHRPEPFTPADPARITFYTCGPTVYDDAHIGNFRAFLAADLLRRWLESPLCELANAPAGSPRRVVHVMNITDVGHMTDDASADGGGEDKMAAAERRLLEAKKAGTLPKGVDIDPKDPRGIASFYAARFLEDARAVGLKVAIEAQRDPSLMPRATDHIEGMKALIETLADKGLAYAAGEPGARAVYFDVQAYDRLAGDAPYGVLSGNTLDHLRAGAGGRVSDENQSQKKHPADFLLWKEDASHLMRWPSPRVGAEALGEGYPGWHIECSAMARARLMDAGDTIDLHSGGEDNIFPHHECEIAQTRGVTGADRFARHWFHPRFLLVDGTKMSKSKGNFYTIRQLIEMGHDPAAIRLELIKTHYRSNANFTMQGLKDSARMIERWRRVGRLETLPAERPEAPVLDAFARSLGDDLNIAGAIGELNAWVSSIAEPTGTDRAIMTILDDILGVLSLKQTDAAQTALGVYLPGVSPSDDIEAKLRARKEARAGKDFAAADAIRDELSAMGLAIKDRPDGTVEVSRA
ncbi:MAG: cysteine--tRNA ligase [Phycisphaerales bacterium JB037]